MMSAVISPGNGSPWCSHPPRRLGPLLQLGPAENGRTVISFLQELKDRGLHDLAVEYIGRPRADGDLPESVKFVLDYEEARTLIDEAAKSGDMVRREDLLKEARDKLEGFVKAHPQLSPDAQMPWCIGPSSLSSAATWRCSERGSDRQGEEGGQGGRIARRLRRGARGLCQGHRALAAAYKKFPGFIPRKPTREPPSASGSTRHAGCHATKGCCRLRAG